MMMKKIYLILLLSVIRFPIHAEDNFKWENATVYFLITDRFLNGDSSNDVNYGRINDYGSERMNAATFHGGDFKGILQKAKEGYFQELGVDVVWMTDIYEQIHGWMAGSGSVNDFPHYGYHGYYPLDYTQIDKNYGTIEEFRELVDTLHSQGIRVMLGANLNNPGYPTLLDAVQLGFTDTGLSENAAAQHIKDWSYDEFFGERLDWEGWYDRDWVRMPNENWNEENPLEATLYGMPDYKDENLNPVKIPKFLHKKWKNEGQKNKEWQHPKANELRKDRKSSPVDYIIEWIVAWIEEFGIDGFRCDIVENVHPFRWEELYVKSNVALNKWRKNNPTKPGANWKDDFYMTGDFDNAYIDYKPKYAKAGFKSMVNCQFPKEGNLEGIMEIWKEYADSVQTHSNWHPFNYLNNSYHRDANQEKMADCATTLLLCPGIAQIFYGDETNRQMSEARLNVDSAQAFRSDMNWNSIDEHLLTHFKKLGKIRKENPVIASGAQITVNNRVCHRYNHVDLVTIILNPVEGETIDIGNFYETGTLLKDLYSNETVEVFNNYVTIPEIEDNLMILKKIPDK